jgi:hypothetical protein
MSISERFGYPNTGPLAKPTVLWHTYSMENTTATMTETYTTLTAAAMRSLADTFAGEVVDYIFADERWAEFLMEIVPEALSKKVGELAMDDNIELAMLVIDKIILKATNY